MKWFSTHSKLHVIYLAYTRAILKVRSPKWWGRRETIRRSVGHTVVIGASSTHARLRCDGQSWLGRPWKWSFHLNVTAKFKVLAVIQFLNTKGVKLDEKQLTEVQLWCMSRTFAGQPVRNRFCSDEEMKDEVQHFLKDMVATWYDTTILKLPQHLWKCINWNGNYVEK